MNMRERVARALFDHWVEEDFSNEYCSWELLPGKDLWLDRADAVLAAMMEPTEEMIWKAHDRIAGDGDIKDVWQAMLSAAQQEG